MLEKLKISPRRFIYLVLGCAGILAVYLFQDYLDFYRLLLFREPQRLHYKVEFANSINPLAFTVNKSLRYICNDLFAICIIYGLFGKGQYVRFAMYVMLFGLIILVPAYIFLYLEQPVGFSSMLSHLHRITMNPVLMMLLIPALYFQERSAREENEG